VLQGWEFNEKTHLLKYRFKKVVGEWVTMVGSFFRAAA
jgi:hypothetical protein